jgi:hypothetical protein
MSRMVRCARYRNISVPVQLHWSNYRSGFFRPYRISIKRTQSQPRFTRPVGSFKPFRDRNVPAKVHQWPRKRGRALIAKSNSQRFRPGEISPLLLWSWLPSQSRFASQPACLCAGHLSTRFPLSHASLFLRAVLFGGICQHFPDLCAGEPGVFPCEIDHVLVIVIRCHRKLT